MIKKTDEKQSKQLDYATSNYFPLGQKPNKQAEDAHIMCKDWVTLGKLTFIPGKFPPKK